MKSLIKLFKHQLNPIKMKKTTQKQIIQLLTIFTQIGNIQQEKEIIYEYTEGRTDDVTGLNHEEATRIIEYYTVIKPLGEAREKVIDLAFAADILVRGVSTPESFKNNSDRMDSFLTKQGVKKRFIELTPSELKRTEKHFYAVMKMISKQQIKILHTLLNKTGQMQHKREVIYNFSNRRTTSSRELSYDEAKHLISRLNDSDPFQKMRKKVFALAYESGMIYGDTPEDIKMNAAKIDMFLKSRGTVKKPLIELNLTELNKVVNQFFMMAKKMPEQEAKKAVNELLTECELKTA